ncbi:hypothetical protein H6G36_30225 [Anabaena minutissima FACHB-250]|nr:hypothetical protein [Anabaena minutissima FACHB-250]
MPTASPIATIRMGYGIKCCHDYFGHHCDRHPLFTSIAIAASVSKKAAVNIVGHRTNILPLILFFLTYVRELSF